MIFKRLEIFNYGIFKGEHSVAFAGPSIQSVTLVGGLNGSGKTTIFEAIQIALFGSQSNLHKENKQPSYIKYLASKINRDTDKKVGTALKFTINLSDDIGIEEDITIVRSWKNTTKGLKEYFEVYKNDIVDIDLSENWIEFISQIISPNLSKLFLFDGEKILQYADPQNTSALLIQGIQILFGADLISDLEDDLKILKKRIIKSFDSESVSGLEELEKKITELHKHIRSSEKELKKKQDELLIYQNRFNALENKFDAYGLKKLTKAKELESNLQTLILKKEQILKQQAQIISGSMPLNLVEQRLSNIKKNLAAATEFKDFENKISAFKERDKEVLKQIKKTKNDSIYDDLKNFLSSNIKDLSAARPRLKNSSFISTNQDHLLLEKEIKDELNNFGKLKAELDGLTLNIEQIERSISRVPDSKDSQSLFKKRDALIKDIANFEFEIKEITETLEQYENDEKILNLKYKQAFDKEVDNLQAESVQSKHLQRIKFVEKILEKFNKEIVSRSIKSIEKLITQKFQYLIRKNTLVEKFSIERSDFILSAINEKGISIELIDLSAGERQILAISILWSLSELSKTNIPVIIDTPLGRLDSKHRTQLITKYFPEAGPQTIILSTDEEIIGSYYKTFKPYIGKQYLCSENKKAPGSGLIKEGYF
tara:strand:+ start:4363 stop:6330 length:1968 start_codon:yes stop_codon:yes gene_type:complete